MSAATASRTEPRNPVDEDEDSPQEPSAAAVRRSLDEPNWAIPNTDQIPSDQGSEGREDS